MIRTGLFFFLSIIFCNASLAQTSYEELETPTPRSPGLFGTSVAGIDDVDGDGMGDVIVGAMWEANLAGLAHVFSGATGDFIRTLESPTPSGSGNFGLAVASVPDLDDDSIADIAIGTSTEGDATSGFGRVHVFSGSTGSFLYSVISPNPEGAGQSFPSFGSDVAGIPDVDGDGHGDIIVGARAEDTGDAGRAYLFSGDTGNLLHTFSSENPESSGLFGFRVDGVPDVDGDGIDDIIIGAPAEDDTNNNQGRAYLFSGSSGNHLRTFVSPNPSTGGLFGRHVRGISDTNGDARGDIVIGAGGDLTSGRAYLISATDGALLHTFESPNPVTGGRFGRAIGVAPDLDGDNIDDVLVGAPIEQVGGQSVGRAYVFSSTSGLLLTPLSSPNPKGGGAFGSSIDGIPDTNEDTNGDIIVGAEVEDGPAMSSGNAYIVTNVVMVSTEPEPELMTSTLEIFPNPADTEVMFRYTDSRLQKADLVLYDVLGREIAATRTDQSGLDTTFEGRLDVSDLPNGVYVAVVSTPFGISSQRVVVVH